MSLQVCNQQSAVVATGPQGQLQMIVSPQVTGSQIQLGVVQGQGLAPTGPQQAESSQETKPFQFTAQGAINESKQLVARAEELLNI